MSIFRKTGSKTVGIIVVSCLIFGIIFLTISTLVTNHMAKNEIKRIISAKGGKVLNIQKVELEKSPFLDTMNSRKDTGGIYPNKFYKIDYMMDNKKAVAWYRAVNGIFTIRGKTTDIYDEAIKEKPENKERIRRYGERWIFE
ncbi:hypothetical protein M3223_12095 [Paenibacillus pasadenensis]|uniref:hypothetical protein n=1 Tax=Paenibacillus pasadenensis TaxID=217090 RepID=UPI00203F9A1F|nr:hypothetical protein [Paenibacillus pasadenensis]MCM3748095.1 hypothetical protein [Paenibacillus pasadenensis]